MSLKLIKRLVFSDGERQALAPLVPSGRDMQRYLIIAMLVSLPCLAASVYYFGWRVPAMVAVATAAGMGVEIAFGLIRKKPISGGALVFAMLLVLILPPEIPLWMVALGSAFGIFFAKEVFGGTGNHVFSPVLISKGFLMFSYPQVVKGSYFGSILGFENTDAWIICSCLILLGGVLMVIARPSNIQIIAGIVFSGTALSLCLSKFGYLPFGTILELIVTDGFLFGACLLACDPSSSPHDKHGRLFYGLLIGTVAVLMRSFSNYSEAMMSAILIGNLFAPMIDAITLIGKDSPRRHEGTEETPREVVESE